MKYMSIKEASEKWGISDSRIRLLCRQGRVEGARKVGKSWTIPVEAAKPIDGRERIRKSYLGLQHDFTLINSLKERIDKHRPLPKETIKSLNEKLLVEWTYNSNAIEGNTLTISETKVVLEGITVGGKSIKEHLEIINHRDAILFLERLVSNKEAISEWNIRNIHSLILKEIDNPNRGKYRSENVLISGANHIPPSHYDLPGLMQELIEEYNTNWGAYHPVVRGVLLHGEFVKIHPFIDGNGRTARLLLNFELMRSGYPPIVIKNRDKAQYYEVLDLAHTKMDYHLFIEMVAALVIESEELMLAVLDR